LIADIIQQDRQNPATTNRVMPLAFAFFKRYAMFCMGNMGWKRRVWRGYESLGSEIEFCNTLRERQIAFKWLNEAYTTIVKIIFKIKLSNKFKAVSLLCQVGI